MARPLSPIGAGSEARLPQAAPSPLGWIRQALGSALFNLIMWLAVAIYAPLMLLTFPLSFAQRYYWITRWAAFQIGCLRVLCGVRHEVQGLERLPKGPAIIMSKHQSTW